jgi:N-acetylglucosaminyl-diphospho-decaprenol L-rhamnosyltransferase
VVVVDSGSIDGSLDTVADLSVEEVPLLTNRGFAHACNVGWRRGSAQFVLFLNADAFLDEASLSTLARCLERDRQAGAAAPRTVDLVGALTLTQHRFPSLKSTYAQALFLHRCIPRLCEDVVDEQAYVVPGTPDWVDGSCLLVRRVLLEQLEGFDERFFLYCEDTDLCLRLRSAGFDIHYEPSALCVHEGGGSAPRVSLLPVLAESRILYARSHYGRVRAALATAGIAVRALTRILVMRGGGPARAAHIESIGRILRTADSGRPPNGTAYRPQTKS